MKNILQQVIINKDSVYPKLNSLLENLDLTPLVPILDDVKEKSLYSSFFHGLHHSQKVCLFTYLICKELKINEVDTQILLDAALYHDIGRLDDTEEVFHGFNSARKIASVVTHPIYDDEINLVYLRAICDAHSLDDVKLPKIFQNYKYENSEVEFERFSMLCSILKDADALDRTRFKKTCNAALKEKFLRLEYSRTLVELSNLINSHYAFKVSEKDYESYKSRFENKENKCGCFHGVGFDFFKLESILKSGILSSFEATRQKIDIVRNFNGNNKNIWISVVDADSVTNDGKAYNQFIKQGISFFAFVPELIKGTKSDKNSNYNLACNSGEYDDESFVFNEISTENIHSIVIFKDNWNKNIGELFYLYGANNYDIIYEKVISYIINIKQESGFEVDFSKAELFLKEYRSMVLKFEKLPIDEQKKNLNNFLLKIDQIIQKINGIVQEWFVKHYQVLLNTDRTDIKLSDVISFILKKEKIEICDIHDNKDEIMLVLNSELEKQMPKKI